MGRKTIFVLIVIVCVFLQVLDEDSLYVFGQIPSDEIATCEAGSPEALCKPTCDCYLSPDCGFLSFCGDYNKCTGVPDTTGNKATGWNFDGTCSFLGLIAVTNNTAVRLLAADAVSLYLKAYEVAGSSGGGPPDPDLIKEAGELQLVLQNQRVAQTLAEDIVVMTVGPTSFVNNLPHRPGFYNPPGFNLENRMGTVNQFDEATLAVLSFVREGVAAEIKDPGKGIFQQHMMNLQEKVPNYESFGRCEFPHPPEHGHEFLYEDGIDCLTDELRRSLNSFNSIVDEGLTSVQQISSDGSVKIIITTEEPTEGKMLSVNVQFVDTDSLGYRKHANYDIGVTQNGESLLSESEVYSLRGSNTHITSTLLSSDPVDVKIVLRGFGLPDDKENWYGPQGESLSVTVVPEFGHLAIIALGLSILSILIINTRFRILRKQCIIS